MITIEEVSLFILIIGTITLLQTHRSLSVPITTEVVHSILSTLLILILLDSILWYLSFLTEIIPSVDCERGSDVYIDFHARTNKEALFQYCFSTSDSLRLCYWKGSQHHPLDVIWLPLVFLMCVWETWNCPMVTT